MATPALIVPMFLPDDTVNAVVAALAGKLAVDGAAVAVETIGEKDFDDDDQLVLQLPAVRVRYDSSAYQARENKARVYDTEHLVQIWCAAENLASTEAQRSDTLFLLRQVLPLLVGVRLQLEDGSQLDPIRIVAISSLPDDNIGTIYIITAVVPGTAQFPGGN